MDDPILSDAALLAEVARLRARNAELEVALAAQQKDRLELAQEVAGLGTWRYDVDSGLMALDARAGTHYGVSATTLPTSVLRELIHPDDLGGLMQAMPAALDPAGDGRLAIEHRVALPEGGIRWLAIHMRTVFCGEGAARRPTFAYGTTQDITARKADEAALQVAYAAAAASARTAAEHAARLASLLAHAPIGIALLDTELRFQHINAHLAASNQLAPEAHLGRTIREVLPEIAPLLEQCFEQVLASGAPLLNVELVDETYRQAWLGSYFPVRATDGALLGVGVVGLDITAQRQAQQALEYERQQLDAIIHVLHEALIAFHPDGTIALINPAGMQLAGITANDGLTTLAAIGQAIGMLPIDASGQPLPPSDYPFARILRGERFLELELHLWHPQHGTERWLVFSGTPVFDTQGRLVMGVVTSYDITRRKEAELALQARSEALARANAELTRALTLKDEFLGMISHELRTPLTAILGYTDTLEGERYGPLSEHQRAALATISKSGRQLLAILSAMLDLAYIEAGELWLDRQPIDVERLCRTAVQFTHAAAQQKDIRLLRGVADAVEGLYADERRLTQVLVNLLDNAIKFTPAGGSVGLEVRADAAQEQIVFTIWDTGIGIAEADYARLFLPFTQVDGRLARKYGGMGLGLSLVRRLVDLHGGSISLESTPGQGSRFDVRLPWRADMQAAPPASHEQTPWAWAKPPLVVFAEDHEATLAYYAERLRAQGCAVVLARTGAEAVAQVRATRPDVALLDIQMPELDGLRAIKQIRADPEVGRTPIIALTALAMPGDRERCRTAGASAYLAKPVSLRTLLATIAEVLAGSTAGHPGEAAPG